MEKTWLDVVTSVVKRAVMSPDYMREAWARDIQNIKVRKGFDVVDHAVQPAVMSQVTCVRPGPATSRTSEHFEGAKCAVQGLTS